MLLWMRERRNSNESPEFKPDAQQHDQGEKQELPHMDARETAVMSEVSRVVKECFQERMKT